MSTTEINPRLRVQWELARRAKAYNIDRKNEEFDTAKIAENLRKSLEKVNPGVLRLALKIEFDKSKLIEPQWKKYVTELFEMHEGWRSFDFSVHPLHSYKPEDSSKRSYELFKDVRVRQKGNTHDILKYLTGFLTPKSIHFADAISVRISDLSKSLEIEPLVKKDYREKVPFYEAITLKDMKRVGEFYNSQVGFHVVKDSEKRNVSAHIAVESGEGYVARGDYFYSPGIEDPNKIKLFMNEIERVYKYILEGRKVATVKDVSQNLGLDFQTARMTLIRLWKNCFLDRRRNDFIFANTDELVKWGVQDNNAYEFIWNSNRLGEKHPSKLPFDWDPSSWIDYSTSKEVVNDFYAYLLQYGFKPRMRTTGGKIGGAHVILNLDFNRIPVNYSYPFPRDKKLEKVINESGNEGIIVAAATDFMRSLILDFGIQRKKPTPITLETYNVAERMHNIYADFTRVYPNIGVRSLGSIHHKRREGGPFICIAWDGFLPKDEKEVRSRSTMEYVFKNPEILTEPPYSANDNPFSLVEETFERTSRIPPAYAMNPTKFYIRNIRRPN